MHFLLLNLVVVHNVMLLSHVLYRNAGVYVVMM